MNFLRNYLEKMRGGKQCPPRAPWHEIIWSGIGSFLGIYAIYALSRFHDLQLQDSVFLVGSFGASAVLIYGVPNSPFAQPRNLVGGHLFSALVGVSCAFAFKSQPALGIGIAAAAAVSLALIVMHLTCTIHPPGGATALIAVIGGSKVQDLGYWYALAPIGVGALLMLLVAIIVNNHSPYRRYPQYWL